MNTRRWHYGKLAIIIIGIFLLFTSSFLWKLSRYKDTAKQSNIQETHKAIRSDRNDNEDEIQKKKIAQVDDNDEYDDSDENDVKNHKSYIHNAYEDDNRNKNKNKESAADAFSESIFDKNGENYDDNSGIETEDNYKTHNKIGSRELKYKPARNRHGILKPLQSIKIRSNNYQRRKTGKGRKIFNKIKNKKSFLHNQKVIQQNSNIKLSITDKVLLSFSVNGKKLGKVTVGLFGFIAPKYTEDFVKLCTGFRSAGSNQLYKDSKVNKVVKNFAIRDVDQNKYGEDEEFILRHTGAGRINLDSKGAKTDTSHLSFLLSNAKNFDGKFVVFGKVLSGMHSLRLIESLKVKDGESLNKVAIADCEAVIVDTTIDAGT